MLVSMSVLSGYAQTTNMEFVENVTDSLVMALTGKVPDIRNGPVCIVNAGGKHELNWLFEQRLLDYFRNQYVEEIYIRDQSESCFGSNDERRNLHTIEYDIQGFKIAYEQKRGVPESPDLYQRGVLLNVRFRVLAQPRARVVWNGDLKIYETDLINSDTISAIENDDESYTRGEYIKAGTGSSVVQPLLIATVTGAVVYLFFAFRSR